MQAENPPGVADTNRSHGFAENYAVSPDRPDEMIAPDGSLRPHWREFAGMLDELGFKGI